MQTNWMDRQRHELHAYEYLCHVGEALQWIEGCLDEEVGFGVVEMEDALGDGVVLAKLARCFMGEGVVRSIWTVSIGWGKASHIYSRLFKEGDVG
jgi:Ras GTPase-activating-like protein IQGAP2/3